MSTGSHAVWQGVLFVQSVFVHSVLVRALQVQAEYSGSLFVVCYVTYDDIRCDEWTMTRTC